MRSEEEIVADIDRVIEIGRARFLKTRDPSSTALCPAEIEWLTSVERTELHRLQIELVGVESTILEIRSRLAKKRADSLARKLLE